MVLERGFGRRRCSSKLSSPSGLPPCPCASSRSAASRSLAVGRASFSVAAFIRVQIVVSRHRDRPAVPKSSRASVSASGASPSASAGFGRVAVGGPRLGLVALEQRIAFQLALDIFGQFEIGQLQQLDRLLQLRRHDQGLALPQLQTLAERHEPPLPRLEREPLAEIDPAHVACRGRCRQACLPSAPGRHG